MKQKKPVDPQNVDWLIWGHEPYGVLAACLAVRLGYKVVIVRDSPQRSWSRRTAFNGQNIEFGTGAILSFLDGDGTSEVLRQLIHRIFPNLSPEELRARLSLKRTFASVCTPDFRLPIYASISELQEEWRWEIGPVGDLEPFFKRHQFFEWESFLARSLKLKLKPGPELKSVKLPAQAPVENRRAFVDGVHFALVDAESGSIQEREFVRVLSSCREQLFHEAGRSAISEGLLELARELGVEVIEDSEVERIDVEGGRARRVHLRGRKPCDAHHVLAQRSLAELRKVCKMPISFRRLKESREPRGWRFCAGLTLHPDFMPAMLGHRMIWKEPHAPVVSLEVMKSGEVALSTVLPFQEETLSPDYQALMMSRMFRLVTEVFPFMEYYLVRMFPDFREGNLPDEMKEVYAFDRLEAIPGELLYYPHPGVKATADGYRSGIKNLYVCSPESYPNLGQYGTMLAAFEAVLAGVTSSGKEALARAREWMGVPQT